MSGLNIDLGGWIINAKILVPMTKILKIPSQKLKLLKAIDAPHLKEMSNFAKNGCEDAHVILQSSDMCRGNKDHQPFFITLLVNGLLLHNCMYDSGASSCFMTKKVLNQLNLRISRPYHNICAMDSKIIAFCGLIKDLQVHLVVHPDIMITMDIVVNDVPDAWEILLSRK